jgi:hypothetical protein
VGGGLSGDSPNCQVGGSGVIYSRKPTRNGSMMVTWTCKGDHNGAQLATTPIDMAAFATTPTSYNVDDCQLDVLKGFLNATVIIIALLMLR